MRIRIMNDSAVSEVVGVMLLLSVTLVIAAVVAVYATGSASEPRQPIKADLVASGVARDGNTYQVIFDHRSGEPFNVDQLAVGIASRENLTVHTLLRNERGESGERCIETFDPDSQMVLLGDRFKVSIGECDDTNKQVMGKEGEEVLYTIPYGQHLTYRFVDSHAGCVISSGEILIREPRE